MSGLFKGGGIGKIFKKVVKVVKKVALPALAIAAVVVTGGAALGLLPGIAGLGGLAASLGASPLIAGVLSAAGTGATIGAIGGLVTTGSLKGAIKGATTGFVTGAITGGIGGALGGGVTGSVGTAAQAGGSVLDGVAPLASMPETLTGVVNGLPSMGQVASGIGGAVGQAASGIGSGLGQAATSLVGTSAGSGGGILGFLNRNPLLASGVMKGIGGALQSKAQLDVIKQRRNSYDVNGVFQPYQMSDADNGQDPGQRYNEVIYGQGQYEYDPKSGRILPKAGG